MAEFPEFARPVGRTRRVMGLVLVALGVAIWARMGWMVAFYWPGFGRNEWLRFTFWLWVGIVLALVGFWLAYRSRVAAWAAALVFVGFIVGVSIYDFWLR